MARPIYEIAREIKNDWKNIRPDYYEAYLAPMFQLDTIDDNYFFDDAGAVLRYFLANAQGWRGETAKRVKKEIKDMLAA